MVGSRRPHCAGLLSYVPVSPAHPSWPSRNRQVRDEHDYKDDNKINQGGIHFFAPPRSGKAFFLGRFGVMLFSGLGGVLRPPRNAASNRRNASCFPNSAFALREELMTAPDWPSYETGPPDHMHALGVISVNYNAFEGAFFALFRHHIVRVGLDIDVAWNIWSKLQGGPKQDCLKSVFEKHEKDPEIFGHISHLLDYFNVCDQNRNTLLHAVHTGLSSGSDLDLRKNIRGDWSTIYAFKVSRVVLRRIADEMNAGTDYLFRVYIYLQRRDGSVTTEGFWKMLVQLSPQSLPKKPPLPQSLQSPRFPRDSTIPEPPPDPSPALS